MNMHNKTPAYKTRYQTDTKHKYYKNILIFNNIINHLHVKT